MKHKRIIAAGALVAAGAMLLSGCTPPRASEVVKGTKITVAMNDVFSGYNTNLTNLNSLYNAQVAYMALDRFSYYNDKPELVKNTDFGTLRGHQRRPVDRQVHHQGWREVVGRHRRRRRGHAPVLGCPHART